MLENALIAMENPEDYNVRAEIMLAGLYAHSDCIGVGRLGDWATHDIEHELSAIWDVAHGEGLAILFPAWMTFVSRKNPHKMVQLAERVFDITTGSDEEKITNAIIKLRDWYKKMGLKNYLSEFEQVTQDKFELMATRCTPDGSLGNYLPLSKNDIVEIFKLAW